MTRMLRIVTALSLAGALAATTVVACGGRPGSPGDMPAPAPRPDPMDPAAPSPVPVNPDPTLTPHDAGPAMSPGPISTVRAVPSPEFASAGATQDAGTPDSYTPPLPPIPDAGVPLDARGLEPK
jgi:hypothetical protein